MTNLPMFPEHGSENDNTPLPLLVAKKWDFPLAFHIVEGKHMYAIQDWLRGLTGMKNIGPAWDHFKKQDAWSQTFNSIESLKYKATDGKTYSREFIDDKGLYIITQYLRIKKSRPVLLEIRKYLAAAGVLVDEMRRDEDLIVISSKMTSDEMIAARERAEGAIRKAYRREGKSEEWIKSRMDARTKRNEFTAALSKAVMEMLTPRHYATVTDDIYLGLWERTASYLKRELELPKKANLRDHQPRMALHFQGIVEEATTYELGEKQEVAWEEARHIVQRTAEMIRPWVKQMQDHLKIDIATGRPLLKHG